MIIQKFHFCLKNEITYYFKYFLKMATQIDSGKDIVAILEDYVPKITQYQIDDLLAISYPYDEYRLLSLTKRPDLVYEVINLLNTKGFKSTYKFLKEVYEIENINSKIVFENEIFDDNRTNYEKEISFVRDKIKMKFSDMPCRRCNNKTVIQTSKQTRSGDEGVTIFYNCVSCEAKWRQS